MPPPTTCDHDLVQEVVEGKASHHMIRVEPESNRDHQKLKTNSVMSHVTWDHQAPLARGVASACIRITCKP